MDKRLGNRGTTRMRARWLALGATVACAAASAAEVQVSTSEVTDFEFDWGRDGAFCFDCNHGAGNARLTFTTAFNELWVGGVDPNTGAFIPANGRGELVDVDAATAPDFGNGPEWMLSAQGSQITYTKYLAGLPHSPENAGIGVATLTANGWSSGFMTDGEQRLQPLGSLDVGDLQPRLSYKDLANDVFWRFASDPASEELIPRSDEQGASRRWVPGRQATIFIGIAEPRGGGTGRSQVFLHDVQTHQVSQLTTDTKTKWGVFMWRAPEFDNEYVFFVLANRNRLVVYRLLPNRQGQLKWTAITTIAAPAASPYIWSPEPFIHNGRSYISMQVSANPDPTNFRTPTHIAITGIDPANPGFRMLTTTADPMRVRNDPEYFITSQGPFLYYSRYVPGTTTSPARSEGIWRVDTGLGPPATP